MVENKSMYRDIKDLTGKHFGELEVLRSARSDECTSAQRGSRDSKWLCECSCGRVLVVLRGNLTTGHTRSCGCTRKTTSMLDPSDALAAKQLRSAWTNIKQRCYNPAADSYPYYGGRGIGVDAQWKDDFTAFRDWALRNGFRHGLSLDRHDPNKDYGPDNCRWLTQLEQQSNKRNSRTCKSGKSLRSECLERGLRYTTVLARVQSGNYTPDEAMDAVISNQYFYGGKTMKSWCDKLGINEPRVKTRMSRHNEVFKDALLYYFRGDQRTTDFIMDNIPAYRDSDRSYYRRSMAEDTHRLRSRNDSDDYTEDEIKLTRELEIDSILRGKSQHNDRSPYVRDTLVERYRHRTYDIPGYTKPRIRNWLLDEIDSINRADEAWESKWIDDDDPEDMNLYIRFDLDEDQ